MAQSQKKKKKVIKPKKEGFSENDVKLGRPTKYKDEFCEQLISMGKKGWAICEACSHWNIGNETFFQWISKHKDFQDAYKIYKQKKNAFYTNWHREMAREPMGKRNATMAIFVSKRACGWTEDNIGDDAPQESVDELDFD